jgi:hypothetical protein
MRLTEAEVRLIETLRYQAKMGALEPLAPERLARILCADAKSPVGKWLATIGILKG